jgi:type VI secretion system secreted protein VgrG
VATTQIDRPFRVKTPLGEDALLLDSFVGHERVSTPFRFVLRLLSPDPNIDMAALLYKPAVMSWQLDENTDRHIHGNIRRMKLLDVGEDGMAAYEAEVVPWLWFLNQFTDSRIFQNKTVPEIIEKVFRDRGFTDFRLQLQGSYPPREYCVQYQETDFNFVSRLMEEEGIFYFFEQSEQKHTLVLANAPSAIAACPFQSDVRFQTSAGRFEDESTVFTLEQQYQAHTGTATLTDYDFEKPKTSLLATLAGTQKGEQFEYPGGYKTKSDADRYARIRLEEQEVGLVTVQGASNCMGFECGFKFTLSEHYRSAANQPYAIVTLEHNGRNTSYRAGNDDKFHYDNRFEAIPSVVQFRPPRTSRRPVIDGSQTAVVAGPSGEEIYTDKYGRIKVQFFWDREGKNNENSSCWIRVAQEWAGKNWGSLHIPRIGQEVVVSFLEGDPDRPLVTGSVYNADQMPPFALPGEQNRSGLRSMSTKGGGGYNEIRLDDTKGSEMMFVHGQLDADIRIERDRKEWIGRDRNLIVTRDKLEKVSRDSHVETTRDVIGKIGRDHHLEITGKEAIKITGSHSLAVTGDVIEEFKANHSTQVTQNIYIKGMQVVIEAATGITLKVGGNFITIDPSGVAVKGIMIQLNSAGAALSGAAGALVSPLSPTAALEAIQSQAGEVTAVAGAGAAVAHMSLEAIQPAAPPPRQSAAGNAPTHDPNSTANQPKKSWIEIQLVDEDGKPVAGEPYRVTLPDGTVADGTLDNKGFARIDHIDPGSCQVTFPNMDQEAWEQA